MKLRFALLASTVFPLAMGYPALALEQPARPLILAQTDEAPCPEGEACPPVVDEAPPVVEETPPVVEEAPPVMEDAPPVVEDAPLVVEEAPPVVEETPPAVDEPPPVIEEPPPAVDEPPPADAAPVEDTMQPDTAPAQDSALPPDQIAPAVEEDTTVEQQLDAQGDEAEAKSVRTLRDRLREQLEGAGVRPEQIEEAPQADGERPRNRDARRDRNRGGGWWDTDRDENVVGRRGGRIVIDLGGGRLSVEPVAPDEGGRLLYGADDVEVQNLPRGMTRTIVHRRNGVDIVTVRDRYGDIVKRSKIFPDGTEIVLIDNRFPDDYQGERPQRLRNLPPLVIGIPEDTYIVDYGDASDDDIRSALIAPPVQQLERPYRLDEVLQNEEVRAYSPRIDLDSITFETGSATIAKDQMRSLFQLGEAMEQVILDRPDEVYLIEGHTDAVGRAGDNLVLSDQRAESVATALSQNFDIPPENLVTRGYGEEYLKVDTDGPERRNRRAAVRRLTDLLQAQNQ